MTMLKTFKSKVIAMAMAASLLATAFLALPVRAEIVDETTGTTDASITFDEGDLELVAVPDAIEFGTREVGAATSYNATNQAALGPVTVADNRGTGEGWAVQAAAAPFVLQEDGNPVLQGATITLNGVAATPDAVNNPSTAPVPGATNVVISTDSQPSTVVNAAENTGLGVWNTNWNSTTLNYTAGTDRAGTADSIITWTLVDAIV